MELTKENNLRFAQRVIESRKKTELTQKELADKLGEGFYQVDVSGYERGIRKPLPENLVKLAKILHVDTDWLDIGDGEVDYENKSYGRDIYIRHVKSNKKGIKLDPKYNSLSSDDKVIINELIEMFANTKAK